MFLSILEFLSTYTLPPQTLFQFQRILQCLSPKCPQKMLSMGDLVINFFFACLMRVFSGSHLGSSCWNQIIYTDRLLKLSMSAMWIIIGGYSGKPGMLIVGVQNMRGWEHFSFVRFKLARGVLYCFGMINVMVKIF